MILWGILEDSTSLIALSELVTNIYKTRVTLYGYPDGVTLGAINYAEPLIYVVFALLTKLFSGTFTWNLLVVITYSLNAFSFNKLASIFISKRFVRYLAVVGFLLHPYLTYQSQSHLSLLQIWPLLLVLNILLNPVSEQANLRSSSFVSSPGLWIKLGFLCAVQIYLSTYLGFLAGLITLFFLGQSLVEKNWHRASNIFFSLGFTLFLVLPLCYSFFYVKPRNMQFTPQERLQRPIEDFVTFSARPWYYFIPPSESVFFGDISHNIFTSLENKFSSVLFKNYFVREHSTSYIGITSIVLIAFYIVKTRFKPLKSKVILYLLVLNIAILVMSMPPVLPINGKLFPLPSYLIYYFLPFVRVLARFSLINVIFSLLCVGAILNKQSKSLVLLTFILLFSEFLIPFQITQINNLPENFKYVKAMTSNSFVVYPYSYTNYSSFWINQINKGLHNPRDYYYNNGEYSLDVTNSLKSCVGLRKIQNHTNTLLVFENENIEYFNNATKDFGLTTVKCFTGVPSRDKAQKDSKFYTVYFPSKTIDSCIYKISPIKCN